MSALISAVAVVSCALGAVQPAPAGDEAIEQLGQAVVGVWAGEYLLADDAPGLGKKGETLPAWARVDFGVERRVLECTWGVGSLAGRSITFREYGRTVAGDWKCSITPWVDRTKQEAKRAEVRCSLAWTLGGTAIEERLLGLDGGFRGFEFWDPAEKCIRRIYADAQGGMGEGRIAKQGDHWFFQEKHWDPAGKLQTHSVAMSGEIGGDRIVFEHWEVVVDGVSQQPYKDEFRRVKLEAKQESSFGGYDPATKRWKVVAFTPKGEMVTSESWPDAGETLRTPNVALRQIFTISKPDGNAEKYLAKMTYHFEKDRWTIAFTEQTRDGAKIPDEVWTYTRKTAPADTR